MPDPRECAVCGKSIVWYESGLDIVPLDANPVLEKGQYAIVDGRAVWVNGLHEKAQAILEGPRYMSHVMTCKPPERKRK